MMRERRAPRTMEGMVPVTRRTSRRKDIPLPESRLLKPRRKSKKQPRERDSCAI